MNAGARHLTAGVQPGNRGASMQVGEDSPRHIVLSRPDRDQIGDRIDAS